jgi:hypothetical protein
MLMEKDYFMMSLIYGPVNAFAGIFGAAQTSFVMMPAFGCDWCAAADWLAREGAIRNGASEEDVKAVKKIAKKIAEMSVWRRSGETVRRFVE